MAQPDGGGNGFATAEAIAAGSEHASSVDGFAPLAPEGPFAERPELLLAVAFAGGFLLGALLSRRGD